LLVRLGGLSIIFALCVTWFSWTQMDYEVQGKHPDSCEVNHQVFGYAYKYRYTPDSLAYLYMSGGYNWAKMIPPYKYRTLTPTLTALMTKLIPSPPDAMEFLTLTWLWAFYTVSAWTLLSIGVGVGPILLGFIGTLTFWHVYLYQNPWSTDALFYLCAALLILATAREFYWLYLCVIIVGMMNKETLLFLTPLWLIARWQNPFKNWKGLLAIALGLGVYLLPRIQDMTAGAWYLNRFVGITMTHNLQHFPTFLLTVLWAWGLIWIISAYGAVKHRTIFTAWCLMVTGALISCIGAADHGRMMASISPVMFPAISLFFEGVRK